MLLNTNSKNINLVTLSSLIFLLIYNISFKMLEFATTGRISILLMLLCLLTSKTKKNLSMDKRLYLIFLPLPYVLLLFLYVGDFGQLSRFLHLGLYSFLGAWCCANLAENKEFFLVSYLIATTLQAFIIIYSFFSPTYRLFFDTYIINSNNYESDYIYRASGLSSSGGASLSVIQALGVMVGWILLKEKKRLSRLSLLKTWPYIICILCITFSCVLVGRTGFALSLLFCLLSLFQFSIRKALTNLLVMFLVIYILSSYLDFNSFLSADFSWDFFLKWAFGFLYGNDDIFAFLREMSIPPLSYDTFVGTGLLSLINGANPSGHDSGFIQSYYAMGLPFTILLYSVYFIVLFHLLKWNPLPLRILLVVVFFGLEYKEPFLFKYIIMFVILTIYYLNKIEVTEINKKSHENIVSC